jgi:uracil-DNA glycosylase
MVLKDIHNLLEHKVFPVSSSDLLFNQYKDRDSNMDLPEAHKIRRENLVNYLRSFSKRPSTLVVGEAPGPRGCRFSGVPFTSEYQICSSMLPFTGQKSSIGDLPYSENSATIFWRALLPYSQRFFIWNSVPFHPHKKGQSLSVRSPTMDEVRFYSALLSEIILLIKPRQIIAVGKKAEYSLREKGFSCIYVRHPSHGGANEFGAGIKGYLAIRELDNPLVKGRIGDQS